MMDLGIFGGLFGDFWGFLGIFGGFLLDLLKMARQKSTKHLQKDSPTMVDFPLGKSAK